ncbi:sugar ABC transporter substrate-binding protein [Jannaschia pagri]|uniref:Sugar ABC transporter substrate-binding protein n=1 Tax=Jannaschia pagri TaxID=2829797 RepID=A0ABQ4NIB9_9RHOB|nr:MULTISPECIES: polysaccharide biosynthesis/export family protein [unclassified Jannaschia]GIT89718.1 sugar ABC transporter substrate-binding protein [Jannaschia sp. AI_61]GIT94174.1 sugar ABC transporter substrate-binding protein [Jannaschia sp. AI_62]
MSRQLRRGAKTIALFLAVTVVASCATLPRSGPNKREIFAGSVLREGDAFVVSVNDRVTTATAVTPALGFSQSFQNANPIGADTIRPGDTLGLIIYENVEDGLLTNTGASASLIDEVQVDSAGMIFIPYAGRIRAAGNTPEALRRVITRRLDEQTPDPQVLVRRLAGDGATVSIVGGAGAQGVYPIERPTRTLTAMIAAAGGISIEPDIALVSVSRGNRTETAYLRDLYRNPHLDIALRDGDRIFIEEDTRSFTVLGATGAQTRLEFQAEVISAIEALAQVGGLNATLANPTGVFVFRNEPEEIAEAVLGRDDLDGTQRLVYVLDLTQPTGMFNARDFIIRSGDTVYVTEAPIVAWNRSVAAIFGSLGTISSTSATLGIE